MKKMIKMALALLLVAFCAPMVPAQTLEQVNVPENETKQERKAREKRLEALRDSVAFLEADMAIDSGYFVIQAERINLDGRANVMAPQQNTNFVLVQGDKAVIQLAFNTGFSGANGLGGITVEGRVINREKKITKKGDIYYTFGVSGSAVSATVSITVRRRSNDATVFINPNFNSNDMTVYGPLIPYDHTGDRYGKRIFQGRPTQR